MDGESQLWVLEGWQLWAVGIIAMLVVGAAFVWVMRHLGDASLPEHHEYLAPEVTLTGEQRASLTFGSSPDSDEAVDQTVPLSRLGGAGWRDGAELPTERTPDPYAGESPTWAESDPWAVQDSGLESESAAGSARQVSVDDTGPRPRTDELDRERGGHW